MSNISLNELKALKLWLVYKLVWNESKQKYDKIPYSPITGRMTGCNEPYRLEWTTYAEAIECVQRSQGIYSGVGIVLTDGVNGIDIDDRSLEDSLTQEILAMVSSYTERSPSGTGFHTLFTIDESKLPNDFKDTYREWYYSKNGNLNVECYLTSAGGRSRYFTFTGDVIVDLAINDCTEGVLAFLEAYMRRSTQPRTNKSNGQLQAHKQSKRHMQQRSRSKAPYEPKQGQSDGEVMELFSIYDNTYSSLLAGRWEEVGYSSQSEADLAFVQRLLYWSGGDVAQADSIFRASGLMRPKWDEQRGALTYGQATLEKAMQSNYPSNSIRKAMRRSWLASIKKKIGGVT